MTKFMKRVSSAARRMTGVSTPIFGVSWEPPVDERTIVRAFLTFLEDRRALYLPTHLEVDGDVRWSVEAIREKCTELLSELGESSPAAAHVRAIRQACRRYMTGHPPEYPNLMPREQDIGQQAGWLIALGELRAIVGLNIGALSVAYGVKLEDDLASIIPLTEEDEQ